MQLYQEGKFQEAIVIFEQALTVAPTNTGAALNLIQSLLQVLLRFLPQLVLQIQICAVAVC